LFWLLTLLLTFDVDGLSTLPTPLSSASLLPNIKSEK
jgi:hypothetical protein